MKKLISISLAALALAGLAGCAQGGMGRHQGMQGSMPMQGGGMGMGMGMQMMDANSDGMLSKEEFMKHHEMMFDQMKKDSNGMVNLKDMPPMRGGGMMMK